MYAFKTGVSAFREAYLTANLADPATFDDYKARLLRYQILWAMYENTSYRNLHNWAQAFRTSYALTKSIRNIYNPAHRLAEFWKTMVWGGVLDLAAGEEGAIPIVTNNAKLRPAIAQIWKASNWVINKDLVVLFGAALGDVGIKIIDDPDRSEMRLEVIHPSTIRHLDIDDRGYVQAYTLEETRNLDGRSVLFTERVTKAGDIISYETFADGRPYAWNDKAPSWTEEYGFVPFIATQHCSVGGTFGWSEIHPLKSKAIEADDLASGLHDYIRKLVNPVWLFNFKKPKDGIDFTKAGTDPSTNKPNPARDEVPAIYAGDSGAKAQALVTDQVDVEKVGMELDRLLAEMERDLPELQMDIWTVGGYTTGKALKTARQRVERKVIQRRPAYDSGLVRAHQMAIAIGGFKNYAGFEGFSLESYKAGALEHSIPTDRPIFETDAAERLNARKLFWDILIRAKQQNLPLDIVAADLGWSKTKVKSFLAGMPDLNEETTGGSDVVNEQDVQPNST